MHIDWRRLLTSLRIPWADRGPNTSSGNVSIKCPWCRDDPSHHLGISESKEAYYCYRDPNRHSGRSFVSLLMRLGCGRDEAVRLLNEYRLGDRKAPADVPREIRDLTNAWSRFLPATQSDDCLRYLEGRGFSSPRLVCEQYDLRYSPIGKWARRLLIPLYGEHLAWTGRDISGREGVRYLTQSSGAEMPLYVPDATKPKVETMILVEGPLDALKVAWACRTRPIAVAALNGKQIGATKLLGLRTLGSRARNVLIAPDADASTSYAYGLVSEVAGAVKARYIGRATMPPGYKDPGEMPLGEVQTWIDSSIQHLQQSQINRRVFG